MRRRMWLAAALVVSASLALSASQTTVSRSVAANPTQRCIGTFDPAVDYFPDKVTVEDAAGFSVSYHRSYKVVDVRAGGSRERYVLLQCGAPAPPRQGDLSDAQVVRVPITSLYSQSTTHLGLLVDLHRLDVLTGVATKRFLIGDAILERLRGGAIREFAPASVIDTELVASQHPSMLMTGGSPSAELSVVRHAGVPVVADNEWLEATALARGEWLKFMAVFLNEDRKAQQLYNDVKARYRALSAKANAVPDAQKPTVMTGRGNRGDFVIAGGRSYAAALIRDAGGRYVWADNFAAGAPTIDLELQLQRAGNADIWINGGGWASLAAMVKDEPRYGFFKAFKTGQVWVYERRMTDSGANDYWVSAVAHPDLVLADLVKIFHPKLAAAHDFQWYLPLPPR